MGIVRALTLALVTVIGLTPALASAGSTAQSLFLAGVSAYEEPTDGLLAQRGYFLHLQVGPRDGWFRPNFGAQVDFNRGTETTILGQMHYGAEVVANSAYIRPIVGVSGIFGWIHHSSDTNTYIGMAFGALVTAGGEIRISDKDKSSALRLMTGWRFMKANPGGNLSSNDLNAVQMSVGFTF